MKTCKKCGNKEIYKNNLCYECFRDKANDIHRKWISENLNKNREYYINAINNSKVKNCPQCGKEFKSYKGKLFCGRSCNYKNIKEKGIRSNYNNPAYRNGCYTKEKRVKTSSATIHKGACRKYRVEFRKEHDYDFCERCKTSNSLRFETHHIVFASEAPQHKELHNFKNLIYLCIKCHNEIHKHKSLRNGLVEERGLNELFGKNCIVYEKKTIN